MAHIRGSHDDNTLVSCLLHELQTTLYFSALDPSLLPVHLQKRRAQLLLEQLLLLGRVARWYSRKDIDIPLSTPYARATCNNGKHGTISGGAHWPRKASTWPREN